MTRPAFLASFDAFTAYLAAGDWTRTARLVARALDLAPVGFRIEAEGRAYERTAASGLDWSTHYTTLRRKRDKSVVREHHTSRGGSWGIGMEASDVGNPRRTTGAEAIRAAILEAAFRLLIEADAEALASAVDLAEAPPGAPAVEEIEEDDAAEAPAPQGPTLAERLAKGAQVVSVSWLNPYTVPEGGEEARTLWAATFPADDRAGARQAQEQAYAALGCFPGCGWSPGWSPVPRQGRKWSDEAKGRIRRKNLRKRLDKKVPLFADLLEAQELESRPDYFAGK